MRAARVLRLPALHFLLLGAALFVAVPSAPKRPTHPATVRTPIVIAASTVAELREEHERSAGTPPTPAELRTLVESEADEEILYREALLLGLDRADPAVERRVVDKIRFLYGDEAGTDAEALQRGLELGLARDDIVVRRTLVTKMQLLAKRASRGREPDGPELERALTSHLTQHAPRYTQSAVVSLRHVFFSADRRGTALAADAAAGRERLGATPPGADASMGGDVFPLGHDLRDQSRKSLAKVFGTVFADTVMTLAPETWSAPVPSSYGLHLVWISERSAARLPPLREVRPRVLRAYRAAQHAVYLDDLMTALRDLYEIRVEDPSSETGDDA